MLNFDAFYNELNGLVWRGRRQGFVTGLVFGGGLLIGRRVHQAWKLERRKNENQPN